MASASARPTSRRWVGLCASLLLTATAVGGGVLLHLVALGVGELANGGVELELLSLDLALGDLDVLLLELHFAGLDRLGVGDVDLLLDRRLLQRQRLLGLGDLRVDGEPLLLLGGARSLLLEGRVLVGPGRRDPRLLERLLDLRLAQRVEVALLVLDLLEDERLELEAHGLEIEVGLLADLLLERLLIAVELLDGQGADDAAQMAGDRLLDRRPHLVGRNSEETAGGATDGFGVRAYLDLGDGLHVDRDALLGVGRAVGRSRAS